MKTNILSIIGETPLVKTKQLLTNDNLEYFIKLEGHNPGGSVKDRPAFNMINEAIKRGEIDLNAHLVEATSGNTGIALAYIAAVMGLKLTLVMPESATRERILTMRAYGAEVLLTDKERGIEGSRDIADQLVREKDYFMLDQFSNPDNYLAHYKTTGPEIWKQTNQKITHFVSAMGTTGTITGVAKYLKEKNPAIRIIGAQPEEGSRIPGIRKWNEAYLPKIYDSKYIDEIRYVSAEQASKMANKLARKEGVFAGMSSGGAAYIATQLGKELDSGLIVSIACDRGDRYLSSDLFITG